MIFRIFLKSSFSTINRIRLALLIGFLILFGLSLYFDTRFDTIPVGLILADYLMVFLLLGFSIFRERKEFKNGLLIGFGRKTWMGPHILIGLVLGLGFTFLSIAAYDSNDLEFSLYGMAAISSLVMFFKNIRGYYITISDDSVLKDNLINYDFKDIKSIDIQDDKIELLVKSTLKYIHFRFLSDSERKELIEILNKRLADIGSRPNKGYSK